MGTVAGILNADLKTFVEENIKELCLQIGADARPSLPKQEEFFIQKIMKDKNGVYYKNEAIHHSMHRFRRKAHKAGFKKLLILGAFSLGKCLSKGSKILMYDCSYKRVEDVVVDDLLMGPDSKPRKVLFLGSGNEPAYRITLSNGDFFECNESHKLSLKISRNFYGYKKGEVVTLLLSEYLELPQWIKHRCLKLYKTSLDFEYKEVLIDPYLYGVKIGNFRIKHKDIYTKFYKIWAGMKNRCLNPNLDVFKYYGGRGITYDPKWEFYLEFKEDMYFKYLYAKKQLKVKNLSIERINVNGHYCKENCCFIERKDQTKNQRRSKKNKNINEVDLKYFDNNVCSNFYKYIDKKYLYNSREIRLQVLAGILDIHGTKPSKKFPLYRIKIKEDDFLKDNILFLCRSLGFSISWNKVNSSKNSFSYIITISGEIDKIPCRINKINFEFKKSKARNKNLEYPFSIDPIGEKEYFGFGVDNDHLFLHHDFTIIANTEQLCIGLCLYLIAKDPNVRIKIVHVSDDEATNRVRAIKDYIDKDEDFKKLCPHIIPTNIWGSKKLFVKRDFTSKDPTVQAFSVMSASIGGRADVLIFDDPQDYKTAVLEPTTRENIESIFKNIWMSRLATDGEVETIVMMNKWHENDLSSFLMKNSMWAWMQIGVNEDKESLFYEDSFGSKRDIPLWSKFTKQELINRHMELGDRDYNRGYRLIAYSDKDKTFPDFVKCCQYGIKPIRLVSDPRDFIFVGGIDFAGNQRPGTTLVILAVNRQTGKKIPVELRAYSGSIGLTEGIIETWRQYGVELFKAENNATQSVIIDMLISKLNQIEYQKYNIKIEGFQTGRNKADPLVGLPAIQKEMENNEWMFCFDKQFTSDDDREKNLWYRFYLEMLNHPFYITSDFLMAAWFARSAAVDLIRTNRGPQIH